MTDAAFSEAGEAYAPARYEYALDKHGNWTQRTMYRWVERLGRYENEGLVTTREITYF